MIKKFLKVCHVLSTIDQVKINIFITPGWFNSIASVVRLSVPAVLVWGEQRGWSSQNGWKSSLAGGQTNVKLLSLLSVEAAV